MDYDKYPRIIIQTRLADDRRRVHHVKQARIRSAGSTAAPRNGHRQEVCVRNTRYSQAVRVQPAYRQPHKEKRKDRQGDYLDRAQDYRRCGIGS